MIVLWIQHYHGEDLGTLGTFFDEHDIQPIRVALHNNGTIPEQPGAYSAIVSMGGPMSANDGDKYPWIDQELRLMRQAMAKGTPLLGICLGAQLLAKAAGARVRPNHVAEIGWGAVELTDEGLADPLFAGLPRRFEVLHFHGETFDLPAGAVRLAGTPECPNQAFRFGDRVYGLQFHIETTEEMVKDWARECADWIAKHPHVDSRRMVKQAATSARELYRTARIIYRNWLHAIGYGAWLDGDA